MYSKSAALQYLPLVVSAGGFATVLPQDVECVSFDQAIATVVHVHQLVSVDTYIEHNSSFILDGGVTINVTNAPTQLSTTAIATRTDTIINYANAQVSHHKFLYKLTFTEPWLLILLAPPHPSKLPSPTFRG
jgi:hypothetical protein